ncbi:MAG: prepilin-type N-terminal cleavage/methylation domain-containing protein [Parcubacteria group bacterium]
MIRNSPLKADQPRAEKFKVKNSRKGFTLIEMLVVVFVVGIGLIGALSFFNININNQNEVKNELIAAGLAQEGADLVRNIRDYNLLNSKAFDFNLDPASCKAIDFSSLSSHSCVSNQNICTNANLQYCQCGGSCNASTNFIRKITVGGLVNGSRTVTCTVTWNGRTTTANDVLYSTQF